MGLPGSESSWERERVGTSEILFSQNVEEPPARFNEPVPVPSVYQDDRGSIHNFKIGDRRLNLLFTRSGVMRSGDLHRDYQHDFVFSGQVEVWCLTPEGKTVQHVYNSCQHICIPPYTPHIFHFTLDTVLAEWWDGPFHAWFYKPYRRIVEESFQATKPGRFTRYCLLSERQGIVEFFRYAANHQVWLASLAVCLGIGYLLGRRR
jgi:hypothetical protein